MTRRPREPRPLLNGGAEAAGDEAAARLLSRLPALQEDRVARERIWRALGQADRRPHWQWRPLAVGAGVAVVAALALAFGTVTKRPEPALLELATGNVLLAAPQAEWTGGQVGAALPAGTRVRTDGVSSGVIGLTRSALIAEAATDVGLEALGGDTLLRLSGGTLVAEVNPLRAHESFVVLTTRYRVAVKGTIFLVRERSPDDVEVSVSRGRVEVSGAGGVWELVAGQSWTSRHPSDYGADLITDEQRQLLDVAVHSAHRLPLVLPGNDEIARLAAPAETKAPPNEASPSRPEIAERALRAEPPRVAGRPSLVRAPKLMARLDPPSSAGAAPVPSAAVATPASAPAPVVAPVPAPPPLEQALDLVRGHRYPEAERALETLSSGTGPGADIALYELAHLRQRHLGDLSGALAALQQYQTRYPRGSLLQEAEISTIELELARPDASAALSHIDQFLSTYPNSERASEVHWLRGNLLRAHGDCAGALDSYRQVKGGPREEEALYFRAVCQEQLGWTDAAGETLRAYLRRFPSANHAAEAQRALAGR